MAGHSISGPQGNAGTELPYHTPKGHIPTVTQVHMRYLHTTHHVQITDLAYSMWVATALFAAALVLAYMATVQFARIRKG